MGPVFDVMKQCKETLTAPCFELDEESNHPGALMPTLALSTEHRSAAALECLTSMLKVLVNLTNEYIPG